MKKVLLALALVLLLGVGGVVAAAYTTSPDYHVDRSVTIEAPPEVAFAILNDLHRFVEWSPWDKIDPEMNKEFSGAEKGVGAVYHWSGNSEVGEGKMTITAVDQDRQVDVRLEFLKPFQATSKTTWIVAPTEGGCQVTWAMDGRNEGLMPRVFSLFMDMDAMVGKDFENGLDDLKALCEKASSTEAPAKTPEK